MPELPEVEQLRVTLERAIVGLHVRSATLHRPDVLTRALGSPRSAARALLQGERIECLRRHGKQMAIVTASGASLCVQLGMSGRMGVEPESRASSLPTAHRHAEWTLDDHEGTRRRMVFVDPRRFGGLTHLPTPAALIERWNTLGPDALHISGDDLSERLAGSRRPIKSALLDQSMIAGVGNIYADEALFRARVHPATPTVALSRDHLIRLAHAIRAVLQEAVASGGSTLRDYVDAEGRPGAYQEVHLVYGRGGLPCPICRERLTSDSLGGRTTVWCPHCQPRARPQPKPRQLKDATRRR